jgi:putative exosortase-associated protein (TIGR04073 family)
MQKKIFILVLIAQLFIFTFPLFAEDYNALRKLGRGMANLCLSFTEFPVQMGKAKDECQSPIAGFFYGVPRGVVCFAGRIVLGAYETVSFLIPPYKPLIEPEFPLAKENKEIPVE